MDVRLEAGGWRLEERELGIGELVIKKRFVGNHRFGWGFWWVGGVSALVGIKKGTAALARSGAWAKHF